MAKPYNRLVQISEAIAHHTTIFLQKELGGSLGIVTCTHVDLDADLRQGKAYISFYPPLDKEKQLDRILAPHRHALIETIRKQVPVKQIPQLTFYIDKGDARADHINQLIDRI